MTCTRAFHPGLPLGTRAATRTGRSSRSRGRAEDVHVAPWDDEWCCAAYARPTARRRRVGSRLGESRTRQTRRSRRRKGRACGAPVLSARAFPARRGAALSTQRGEAPDTAASHVSSRMPASGEDRRGRATLFVRSGRVTRARPGSRGVAGRGAQVCDPARCAHCTPGGRGARKGGPCPPPRACVLLCPARTYRAHGTVCTPGRCVAGCARRAGCSPRAAALRRGPRCPPMHTRTRACSRTRAIHTHTHTHTQTHTNTHTHTHMYAPPIPHTHLPAPPRGAGARGLRAVETPHLLCHRRPFPAVTGRALLASFRSSRRRGSPCARRRVAGMPKRPGRAAHSAAGGPHRPAGAPRPEWTRPGGRLGRRPSSRTAALGAALRRARQAAARAGPRPAAERARWLAPWRRDIRAAPACARPRRHSTAAAGRPACWPRRKRRRPPGQSSGALTGRGSSLGRRPGLAAWLALAAAMRWDGSSPRAAAAEKRARELRRDSQAEGRAARRVTRRTDDFTGSPPVRPGRPRSDGSGVCRRDRGSAGEDRPARPGVW